MRRLISIALTLSMLATIGASLYGAVPAWAALAALTAWYVLRGPAIAYASPGMPLALTQLEVLADDARTTPASDEWARQVGSRFAPHGFIRRARYRFPHSHAFDFAQRFDNGTTGEVATIMAGWRPTPEEGPAVPVRIVVFYTRFTDGGEVITTNAPVASMSPTLPGQRAYRLPEVRDASALYAMHRRLVKRAGRKPVPIVLGDDPLAWERKQHERSIAIQVRHGLAVRDEEAGRLRPTLKGAIRTTWLLHPWLTRFQARRATREAGAALRVVTA